MNKSVLCTSKMFLLVKEIREICMWNITRNSVEFSFVLSLSLTYTHITHFLSLFLFRCFIAACLLSFSSNYTPPYGFDHATPAFIRSTFHSIYFNAKRERQKECKKSYMNLPRKQALLYYNIILRACNCSKSIIETLKLLCNVQHQNE